MKFPKSKSERVKSEEKEDTEFVGLPSGYKVVMSSNIYENIFLNFNENQEFSFNNFINSGMYFPQIAAYINTIISILKGHYEFTELILVNISSLVFFTAFWYLFKLYKVPGLSFFSCLIGGNFFRYYIHFVPVIIITLIFKQWKILVSFAIVTLIATIVKLVLTAVFDKQKYNDSVVIYTYNLYSKH